MAAGNVVQQGLVDGQPATSSVNFNWPGGQGAWPSQASPGVTSAGDPFQVQNAGVPPVTQASSEGGVAKGIYAGFAYEVHKLAFGQSAPVDPANHIFRSGDQFVLYYRPTLPGRIEVYNINPQGLSFKVDESNVAAAQLVKLGPYQFTDPPGDESLRVVLFPCGSPELAMLTRNIVKVADMGGIQGVQLRECAMPSLQQNPVQTRNIQKVLVEGRTGFALDPLANSEVNSGVIAAREVAIRFNHR